MQPFTTPVDLGFSSHSAFRPFQAQAIEHLLVSEKKLSVVAAPTGAGKSLLALSLARLLARDGKRTRILTSRKVLQDQYTHDYQFDSEPYLVEARGRNNFLCDLPDIDPRPTADHALCVEEGYQCPLKLPADGSPESIPCAYYRQRAVANANPVSVFNYQFYFRDRESYSGNLLICDEAHNIDKEIVAVNTVEITEHDQNEMLRCGFAFSDKRNGLLLIENPSMSDTARAAYGAVMNRWLRKSTAQDTKLAGLVGKLQRVVHLEDKLTVVEDKINDYGRHTITFSPVLSEDFADDLVFARANRVILMSATIFGPDYWASRLGVDATDTEYLEVPSSFPPNRRPVYLDTVVRMGAKTKGDPIVEGKLIRKIDSIITKHMGVKGLIHSVNKDLTELIMTRSSFAGSGLLIQGGGKYNDVALEKFKAAPVGVFVSPSATEGLDFEGDLCRYTIFPKVPYLYQDAVTRIKMDNIPGYYDYQAMAMIIQGAGRGFRSKEDFNEVYILDTMIYPLLRKTQAGLPRWFLESIINVKKE